MWRGVRNREEGRIHPHSFARSVRTDRLSSLDLSNRKEIVSPHRGAINSLQVDLTEGRYLLSGASDGSVAVYDVQHATDYVGGSLIAKHKSLFFVDKQHEQCHKYSISSAIWYPVDTGLFITGSFDRFIKVWDTNMTQVEMNFEMPGKVYGIAMSPVATSHMLIAAGTEDVQVRLCDIASGAFTHTLSGHRDGIMAVEWSTSSEWVLITGGCDGAIRFWDIRRAGCFLGPTSNSFPAGQSFSVKSKMPQKRTTHGSSLKQSTSLLKGQSQTKSYMVQRQHPGMMSIHNRATAHYGAVIGLKVTSDGMYLLSAGSDSRLRLWDVETGCNTLVNFEASRLQTSKAIQLAVSDDSSIVFVPCKTAVKAFDVWSGRTSQIFRGHYECVNCCWFNPHDQDLFTGSNDRQILIWSPSNSVVPEVEGDGDEGMNDDCDSWSD
ncbi:DNA excision repair protein ERCC-8 isoform X1 [Cinnamomum micranthum f. kanehirae]|uniref:DNA excision repair protein ERCC-8 isoform X1 n=1 Tax=Cinnamomum micranthum f. kanehirae TaxID=337451 RepID=A0A443Q2C3_9MAGN|nr:DNA excision repair protein ERCC-8 isoform X1 [Cinnamomum micranthum f. kanehirae]